MLLGVLPFAPAAGSTVAYAAEGAEAPAAAGPIKVASVGDSITEGSGASSGNSYPAQLQKLLGTDYQVNNYGLSGTTLLKKGDKPYWNQTQYINSKNFLPDIVIIQLGTNDSKSQNWANKSDFLENYKELINTYKSLASNPQVYVALPPKVFGTNASNINGTVLKDEITPLVQQAAIETGAAIIDNYAATENLGAYFPDKVHPNDTGAFALSYNVYRNLGFPGAQAKATFFEESNYAGKSFPFPGGAYNSGMLLAAGLSDDSISSLKVNKGSLVEAFENGSFTGGKWIFNEDTPSLTAQSDNKISSLRIVVPGESIKYEAEALTAATSNGRSMISVDDSAASGGKWHRADLTAVGEFIQYTVNVPAAGEYNVKFKTKAHPGRPIFQLYVEGNPYGAEFDGYQADPGSYKEVDSGDVTFDSAGDKTFKFQITGRNPSSTGWYLSMDYIQLTPKPLTITSVAVEGDGQVGSRLTAKVAFKKGLNDADESNFMYQWYRNGNEIPGATAKHYEVAEVDSGKALHVAVTARDVIGAEGNTIQSATVEIGDITSVETWTMENDVLRAKIEFTGAGAIKLTSFFNKEAGREYLPQGVVQNKSTLFRYDYRFLEAGQTGKEAVVSPASINANDPGFVLGTTVHKDIDMKASNGAVKKIGERWEIPVTKNGLTITLSFEIYEGKAGLKYQAYIKNNSPNKRLQITSADVIKLDLPDEARNLHYSYITKWYSTTGGVDFNDCKNPSEDIKVIINRYDTGDGFYLSPEVNGKTQTYAGGNYPQGYKGDRAFAGIRAFKGDMVKVSVNDEVFKLVLYPNEEFEYIAVNMTAFKGDIVDGKMAVEEHLRKRFRYNETSTILMTNDWGWGPPDNNTPPDRRTEEYYRTTVIPKAKEANFDMIMWDDLWNTEEYSTPGTFRDSIVPVPRLTTDMSGLTKFYKDNGFIFGAWYSMSGGYHNSGNDLADPAVIAAKKGMLETLITNYNLKHQMIDLTEYWLNDAVTGYSHPTDNVYRKNVLTRNALNEMVDKYPDYKVKLTTEVDIYPSQGDRSNELLHVINNGWTTTSTELGEIQDIQNYTNLFGHMPLNSTYFNNGDMKTGNMATFYKYMFARNVKHGSKPHEWSQTSIDLVGKFNDWRKTERIKVLTDTMIRPVYNGRGWDSNVAADWDQSAGPYAMMHVAENKDQALLIATDAGKTSVSSVEVNLRWLDKTKQYLIEDISLDDNGEFTYRFKGLLTGSQLQKFKIDFAENTANGRAYWIEEFQNQDYQLLYADHQVDTYELHVNADQSMVVQGTGKAGTTGKVMIYSRAENKVMNVELQFGDNGSAATVIDEFAETPEPFVVNPPAKLTLVAASLHNAGKTSVSGGSSRVVDGGGTTGTSPGGETVKASNNVVIFESTADTNSYIEFNAHIPQAGIYNVQAVSKLTTNRGTGQWYVDGEPVGQPWSQLHTKDELKSFDLGDMTITTPGDKIFRFQYVSGPSKLLNVDRFEFTPRVKVDEGSPASIEITGETGLKNGQKTVLQAQVTNMLPFYTGGDQVRWMIEEQNAANGAANVISMKPDGLISEITAKNPGTARIKVASLVSTEAVAYIDITVSANLPVIVSLTPVTAVTKAGMAPELPPVTTAVYGDGSTVAVAVAWSPVDPVQYAAPGQFDVHGSVEGTALTAVAHVTVVAAEEPPVIVSLTPVTAVTKAGTAPELPAVTTAVYGDGSKAEVAVAWNSVNPAQYAAAGQFDVYGSVEGTALNAVAHVTVTAVSGGDPDGENPGGGNDGGDSSGGNNGIIGQQEPERQPDDHSLAVDIKLEDWTLALKKADNGKVLVQVPQQAAVTDYHVNLPAAFLLEAAKTEGLTAVELSIGTTSVTIALEDLMANLENSKLLQWSIVRKPSSGISEAAKKWIGSQPLYQVELQADGKPLAKALTARLALGYELKEGQIPEKAVVYLIDAKGSIQPIVSPLYNREERKMVFSGSLANAYAVIYNDTVRFDDIAGVSWAVSGIETLAARGIINGVGEHAFAPDKTLTRAEFITMLMRTFGLDNKTPEGSSFTDVAEGAWHSGAILAAFELGIVNGKGDGLFGPDENVSREDMIVMVYNTLKTAGINLKQAESGKQEFGDNDDISGYAAQAVLALRQAGIINGNGEGLFLPQSNASRAEAAAVIYRLLHLMN